MADLVVVGAGIAGIAAAGEAARTGASVTLIDAGLAGRATTAGAGIVSPIGLDRGATDGPWVDLVAEGVQHLRARAAELDGDLSGSSTFSGCGELVVAVSADARSQLSELETWIGTRAGSGTLATSERLADGDVREMFPWARPDLEALFVPEVGRIDGDRFARALLARARRVGPGKITLVESRAELELDDSRVRVTVDGRRIDGDAIVVATGAWAASWTARLGICVGISPDAGEITHLRPLEGGTGGRPVINTFEGSYLVPFDDRIAVGATHECRPDHRTDVTAGGQYRVLERALNVAPGLGSAALLETRVGLRPASDDGLPLVGPTALPSVVMVGGLGAWGLTLGPLLGAVAARSALGADLPEQFDQVSATRSPSRVATARSPFPQHRRTAS